MNKTSFKQRILLVIFGVLLTVILLEISLRIAGMIVLYLQERHNHLSFNKNEYRILCLGESTTALGGEDAYPTQLERMLNAKSPQKKFTVINKGIISTTTDYILTHIDQNLDMNKPQLAIVMMGINDKAYLHDPYKALWLENIKLYLKDCRVYKLGHLLYQHISHRIKGANAPVKVADPDDDDNIGDHQQTEDFLKYVISNAIGRFSEHAAAADQYLKKQQTAQAHAEGQLAKQSLTLASLTCVELARRFRLRGSLQEAQNFLEKATSLDPNSLDVYQGWGELYLALGKSAQAVIAFKNALILDPKNNDVLLGLARAYYQEHDEKAFFVYAAYLQSKPQDYWGHVELAQWLREAQHYSMAQEYLDEAISIGPFFDQAYVDMGQVLDDQRLYDKEEAFYLKEIALYPTRPRLYQALGQFYEKQGKETLAKEYFKKAAGRQMAEYCPATLVNYSLLLDKILSRHIKVVVMQYPLRDISSLKEYLGQRNGVIFVENRQNFKKALLKGGYSHYFKDNFAYDFGHCTRAGNELIARHLTEVILNNE